MVLLAGGFDMDEYLALGAACVGLTAVGALAGLVFGAALGFAAGWLGARPMLRWGMGQADLAGCLAIGVLVSLGGLGGLWSGIGGGAAWCAHEAINERLLLEDLAITAVVQVATEGRPSADVEENERAIEALLATAGGSLEDLLGTIEAEILAEEPTADVPEFLTPDIVPKLMKVLEDHALFDPGAMATIYAADGLNAARAGDPEVAAYADRLVEAFEPVRREAWLGILTAVVSNAVITMLVVIPVPLILVGCIAAIARLIRRPNAPPASPDPPRPAV
jgi:hypothetical protein